MPVSYPFDCVYRPLCVHHSLTSWSFFRPQDNDCQPVLHLIVYTICCVFITVWSHNRPLGLKNFRPQDNECQSVLHLTVYILSCVSIAVCSPDYPLGLKTMNVSQFCIWLFVTVWPHGHPSYVFHVRLKNYNFIRKLPYFLFGRLGNVCCHTYIGINPR